MADDGRLPVACIGRLDEALRTELLEVEGSQPRGDPDLRCHLGPGERPTRRSHGEVGRPPCRIVQYAEPDDGLVDVAAHPSSNTTSDEDWRLRL
jgi:hypothetical protein